MTTYVRNDRGYEYDDAHNNASHEYLLPIVFSELQRVQWTDKRLVFDLGCGNGSVAHKLRSEGFEVEGIDASEDGIAQAKESYPSLRLELGSAYDDLKARFGTFDVVISLEVVEHLYSPRVFAARVSELLKPDGVAVISTPYHGYWKNLALAVSGKLDDHFTALWDHGHIKFWSRRTLSALLTEAGLVVERFYRVGRIRPLAKSMIMVARKPGVARNR